VFAGALVKTLRKEAGFSAATLGRAVGISARQVRRYESGEFEPPLSVAGRIARAIGVPLDDLYLHEPEPATAANGAPASTHETPANRTPEDAPSSSKKMSAAAGAHTGG
jgi:transcriptional regulator with XRE-family HTH domain